jgi:nicotinamidase-related amidase
MGDSRDNLSDADRAIIDKGSWAQRAGYGRRPALIIIDAQNYMVGKPGNHDDYPLSCGDVGWEAVKHIKRIAETCRARGVPVFYTQFVLAQDGSDAGMFDRKIGVARGENAYFEGTHGADIVADIAPQPGDIHFIKKKPSSFFGTPLQAYLNDRQIDTLIITGGATCNCVRATACESFSLNYRTIVPREAVFDRIPLSHEITLFDIDRFLGDVVSTDEVVGYLDGLPRAND